jgi:hypothetical protein
MDEDLRETLIAVCAAILWSALLWALMVMV